MKFLLERSRYLAFIGIISLLVASFAAFAWGTIKTVTTTLLIFQTLGSDASITIELIELVDSFLIATAILIFAASLYELFIGKLDLPDWMLAHDLYELKAKLSSMIVLVMAVKFLSNLIELKDGMEILQRGIAVAIMSAVLIAFGYFGKKD
jgi:uncharacterized membrane protein YqhA